MEQIKKKRKPMSEETKRKIGLANKGKYVGKKLSDEIKRKIGIAAKGRIVSKETREKLKKINKGKHHSRSTEFQKGHKLSQDVKNKISSTLTGRNLGEKNPSWKGGVTPLNQLIRHSFKNRQWISDVFTRDKFICQICGYDGGRILNAHHIKPFSVLVEEYKIKTYGDAMSCEELWNINNGITLCKNCHIDIHKIPGWSEEDLKNLKMQEKQLITHT